MRVLRLLITIVFVLTTVVFMYFFVNEKLHQDKSVPEIIMDSTEFTVNTNAKKQDFLSGVAAFDDKDGDITDKIVVESVSRFINKGESIVYYAVCDSDNHVCRASRKVKFKNYKSPEFYLTEPLIYSTTDNVDVTDKIKAKDMIDGDISDKIILTIDDIKSKAESSFKLSVQAANSMGDTIYLSIPVLIEKESENAPVINLKSYLIYTKVGQNINFNSYVKNITDTDGKVIKPAINTKTDFDKNKAGTYSINYYATNAKGKTGHTILTVIVEG